MSWPSSRSPNQMPATWVSVSRGVTETGGGGLTKLSAVLDTSIAQCNGAFGRPQRRGCKPASRTAKEDEPLGTISVVCVQGCRIRGVAKSTDDQDRLDANLVGQDSKERATKDHDAGAVSVAETAAKDDETYPKVNEFAPLTRYGSCWPPAPVLFRAFQIPGCVKDIRPTRMTLNNGLRYHFVNRDRGLVVCSTAL